MKRSMIIAVAVLALIGCASMSPAGRSYHDALHQLANGQDYFANVNLISLANQEPPSAYGSTAMFAAGEIFYDNGDYSSAVRMLSRFLSHYPKDKGAIFAKIIIYKIITEYQSDKTLDVQEEALIQQIRKELFSSPLFLIFYDKKAPRSYKSLLKNTYLVYDYVDKIKVFRNDKAFLELTP